MSNAWIALLLVLAYIALCAVCFGRARAQRRDLPPLAARVIAYGSQSGRAESLARALGARCNPPLTPIALNALADADLTPLRELVIITSTYGEGAAPDNAARLLPAWRGSAAPQLTQVKLAVLGLGDRSYQKFCGYAADLEQALVQMGAHQALALHTMHALDEALFSEWQQALAEQLAWSLAAPGASLATFTPWQLHSRQLLNQGSAGAPVFSLALVPAPSDAGDNGRANLIAQNTWEAGDIAEIQPVNTPAAIAQVLGARTDDRAALSTTLATLNLRDLTPALRAQLSSEGIVDATLLARAPRLPTRYYSIASVPREQKLQLLVRQKQLGDGDLGLGSGFLTRELGLADKVLVHIRRNTNFHAAPAAAPLILIGNGTGIAGLRAHLAARAQAHLLKDTRGTAVGSVWLLMGERTRSADRHFADDLHKWQTRGVLSLWHEAFSREADAVRYVQDLIPAQAVQLRAWVDAGAYIFVCGSLSGMAAGVDEALRDTLGAARLAALKTEGRYRRDVY